MDKWAASMYHFRYHLSGMVWVNPVNSRKYSAFVAPGVTCAAFTVCFMPVRTDHDNTGTSCDLERNRFLPAAQTSAWGVGGISYSCPNIKVVVECQDLADLVKG